MKHEFGTIQFHLEHFDELLNGEQSWRLLYLPATVCPCRDRATGSPQPDCPRCRGYGFVWEPPEVREWEETFYRGSTARPEVLPPTVRTEDVVRVVGEGDREYQVALEEDGRIRFIGDEPAHGEAYRVRYRAPLIVRGHGQNLAGRKDIGEYGEIDHRDMSLTLPRRVRVGSAWEENPAYYAGYPDRFVVLDARVKVHQVLYRGEEEALLYAYVYRVLSCVGMEKDYSTTAYTFEDFVFEEGRVVWLPGRGPRAGRPYGITYLAAPEFYVFRELPQVRGQGGQELPRRLHLRLWELFPRPGAALGR